ncbi:MAG: choice-of-anchor D domain-containing protein [Candidatus Schekmanbacteria bacterium]|nr:choice-of-anchor D domain-containing protein [Candidatus Schekmanbacteria bacterium]
MSDRLLYGIRPAGRRLGRPPRALLALVLAALAIVGMPFAPVRAAEPAATDPLDGAMDLINEGRFTEALGLLDAVAETNPSGDRRVETHLRRALCLMRLDKFENAERELSAAAKVAPTYAASPLLYPREIAEGFADALRRLLPPVTAAVITKHPVGTSFSPATRPPEPFARPWYKKWWVWAVAGAVVAGAAYAAADESSAASPGPSAARLLVNPPTYDFGPLTATSQKETQLFTAVNSGDLPLDVTAVTLVEPRQPFFLEAERCSGVTLLKEETCTFRVSVTSTVTGDFSSTVAIESTDAAAAQVLVPVHVAYKIPIVKIDPTSLSLALRSRPTDTVKVTNSGDVKLIWTGPSITSGSSYFKLDRNHCGDEALFPNESCEFTVECYYVPPSVQSISGTLMVFTQAGVPSLEVSLTCRND